MKCRVCRRPALFRARGQKAKPGLHGDDKHDLCGRCWRDERNRGVAKMRAGKGNYPLPEFPPLRALLAAYLGEMP